MNLVCDEQLGPGDCFSYEHMSFGLDVDTMAITQEPTYGKVVAVGNRVVYIPKIKSDELEDSFMFEARDHRGNLVEIFGNVSGRIVTTDFSVTYETTSGLIRLEGQAGHTVNAELMTVLPSIKRADMLGCPNYAMVSTGNTPASGTVVAGLVFRIDVHSILEYLWPSRAQNDCANPILIWSNATGYYWLAPGARSPDGDTADHIRSGGTWYKNSGFSQLRAYIHEDCLPYDEAEGAVVICAMGPTVELDPELLPDADTDAGGNWVPTDAHPLPDDIPTRNGTEFVE